MNGEKPNTVNKDEGSDIIGNTTETQEAVIAGDEVKKVAVDSLRKVRQLRHQAEEENTEHEIAKEDSEILKNAKTSREVHYLKTQKRMREAVARGYDIDKFANSIVGNPYYYGGGSSRNTDTLIHSLKSLEELGADMDAIRYRLPDYEVMENLDVFTKYNPRINIDKIVQSALRDYRSADTVAENLDTLLKNGANIDINELTNSLSSVAIAENIAVLEKHGANIDIAELSEKLDSREKAKYLEALNQRGANIDAKELASRLKPYEIAENLVALENNGAEIDIDELVSELDTREKAKYADSLNKYGGNINLADLIKTPEDLSEVTKYNTITEHDTDLKTLKDKGVPIERLIDRRHINLYNLDYISELGVKFDIDGIISDRYIQEIIDNLDSLIENGADINTLIKKFSNQNGAMSPETRSILDDALERNGLNPDDIKSTGGLYGPYHYERSDSSE